MKVSILLNLDQWIKDDVSILFRRLLASAIADADGFKKPRRFDMQATKEKRTTGTHDEVEGKAHEVKGAVKQKIGDVTNSPDLEDEGQSEKISGKVEKTVGRVKKAFGK